MTRTAARWLCFALLLGCSESTPDGVGERAARLIGGSDDTHDPAVVLVVLYDETANKIDAACTGTVVAPHVVLTAAHCLDPDVIGPGPSGNAWSFLVFIGTDMHSSQGASRANFLDVTAAHRHPEYTATPTAGAPARDIGVLVTKQPLPGAPLPMSRRALDASAVGLAIRVVGDGVTSEGPAALAGKTTEYSGAIQGLARDLFSFQSATQSTCEGDSGGPSLAVLDGREVIVGVHKGGDTTGTGGACLGAVDWDVRVDLYAASFVDPIIAAADPGFTPEGTQTDAGVPEDASGDDAGVPAADAGQPPADGSGCAAAPRRAASDGATALLALLAVLAVLAVRGRRTPPGRPRASKPRRRTRCRTRSCTSSSPPAT
ncbi:MAG TPA: trypsin-like serine protease [Polyangia bacterium]